MDYVVRINKRAKRVLITVHPDARVSITTPRKMRLETIERLMLSKRRWILESQEKMRAKYPAGVVRAKAHSHSTIVLHLYQHILQTMLLCTNCAT
jgi:predicted metal-dependent hydrolase